MLVTAFASPYPSNAAESNFPTSGSWVVPAGVSIIQVSISAGSGGDGGDIAGSTAQGGQGAGITAGLNVAEGETVFIGLGEDGPDFANSSTPAAQSAFNIGAGGAYDFPSGKGGGGGGASAVAIDNSIVVIAGGGGGAGGAVDKVGALFGGPAVSGNGGNGGGGTGQDSGFSDGTYGEGGRGGSGGTPSTLTRTGTDGGGSGADSDTAPGFNADGGGGGAGYYGGLAGSGGSGEIQNAAGGGGGGGSSYLDPTRIPSSNTQASFLSATTPTGSIEYIDISTTSLASAGVNSYFSATLNATFGAADSVDEWTVSPALPTGISLDVNTGLISGTASSTSSGTYEFTATKYGAPFKIAARSSTSLSFSVAAGPSISPASQTVNGTQGSAISSTSTFTPTGFTGSILGRFSVSPPLPVGLVLDMYYGVISGTPTDTDPGTTYTITASDGNGNFADATVLITINAASPALSPATQTVTGTVNSAIVSTAVFTASNFSGTPAYTVTPTLPSGLSINSATGQISGTPTATSSTANYTITATTGSQSATATVTITVSEAAALTPSFASPTARVDGFTVQVSNYDAAFTWAGTTTAGGSLSISSSGLLTVTGLAATTSSTVTLTVSRTGYATGSAAITGASLTAQSITFTAPTQMSVGASSQTVTPTASSSLPVTLTSTTTAICTVSTWTITAVSAGSCSITATQSGDATYAPASSVTHIFTINAAASPALSPATQTVTGTVNSAIVSTAVFTASNFSGTPAYTVTPTLPSGLSINSATGQISGTPTATSSTANYTITATTGSQSATATVTIAIATGSSGQPSESAAGVSTTDTVSTTPFPPNLIASDNGSFTWIVGIESTAQLVVNRGGPATFAIIPEAPPGLDFNAATGVLSGTSSSSIDTAPFTVTATNLHGRSSVDIYITVNANQRIRAEGPAIESVRFSRGSSKMKLALVKKLDEWLQQERAGTTTLTAVVPKSGKGSTLARKRAVQIRKYLRAHDAVIGSTITIMIAPKKTMTRRVLLID